MPKYQQIADDLGTRIRSGEYPPGSALPPQRELSSAYGVTLVTLRQALDVLQSEGLLSQQAGRGTFVAEPKAAYRLSTLRSLAEDLREQGHTVTTAVVSTALRKPPAPYDLPAGSALRLERVRVLGSRPAIHQVSWIPAPWATALRTVDFTTISLYASLADLGVVVHRATERLTPGVLTAAEATALGRKAGVPVFVSERWTYALDGSVVVADRATILGDLVEIRTERAATGLSLQWTAPGRRP
ncbi:GntR family transcriptional regulator [Hamadaea tsunoensis]|uniref:GntR family transcriptional regulator n=1 Tax=Hamadaea tsunoensis TaxID=53368 RepID=UPI0004178C59|nr:GntR family transcriptional regulator [Hamadaea tsunoensis]